MKKLLAVLVILMFVGTAAFAQITLSAGAGLLGDLSFGNGSKGTGDDDWSYSSRNISFGGYVFVDATYAELDVSFSIGSTKASSNEDGTKWTDDKSGSLTQLGVSLLGKYPIELTRELTVFPAVGVSYNLVLGAKYDGEKIEYDGFKASDYSQFGILAGGGVDYSFGYRSPLYFRGELLAHLRFASSAAKEDIKDEKDTKTTLGIGPRLKLGVGYKF